MDNERHFLSPGPLLCYWNGFGATSTTQLKGREGEKTDSGGTDKSRLAVEWASQKETGTGKQ